jgi:two-component system, chemotaxis family, sensor kinase CheA
VAGDQDAKLRRRLETFRTVAQERLDRLNLGWIQFEQGTGGPNAGTVFLREIHTLKGEAGLTGFASVSRLLHRLEDLVGATVKAGSALDASVGDLVMRGLDLAGTVIKRPPEAETEEINTFLAELPRPEGKPAAAAGPAPAPVSPPAAAAPAAQAPAPAAPAAAAAAPAPEAARRGQESVRLTSEKLDGLRDLVAELLLTRVRLERSAAELRNAKETALELRRTTRAPGQMASREINQLGEALSGLEVRLRDEAHQVSRLVGGLDASTRDLRMVPLGFLLDRYPIAVRSLSRKLAKQVQLRTEGDATEVDREVLERLAEPLLHLIQNAVDHGIEDPERRARAGKPPEATIVLRAWLAGQTLHVEVSDDGGGIDARAVRERAISLKILDALSARQLGDDQVIRTIFSAGFSSRSQVTETSGRGIGLNVVLSAVEGLGGRVDVRTTLGHGTVFHLQVPVTVAISAVVLFRTGASRYAIPTSAVETIVESSTDGTVDSVDGRAIKYGGRVVPLLSLENLLGEQAIGANKNGRGGRILIVRSGGDRVALSGSFDHVEREVVLKPAGKFFEQQRLVSAAVHLEDGSLALVLKPAELVFAARGDRRADVAVAGTAAPRTGFGKTVLVVDDSPVVRDLIADALRAHGMRVIEAGDGEEALSLLATHPSIDLVVTDFEMPRLDGIGLIKAQRARETGRRLPMVVVSMRGSESDKRLALDAGADSYLVKSDFSHAGLWTMIARFLG